MEEFYIFFNFYFYLLKKVEEIFLHGSWCYLYLSSFCFKCSLLLRYVFQPYSYSLIVVNISCACSAMFFQQWHTLFSCKLNFFCSLSSKHALQKMLCVFASLKFLSVIFFPVRLQNFLVDIKGPALAYLPVLAFEGGTRRNIPKFEVCAS